MKKKFYVSTIFILLLATFSVKGLEHIQRKQLLDYHWKFALCDYPAARNNDFNDTNWRILNLPHDWSIEGKIDKNNPTGQAGGYFPTGIGWYRKTFYVPSAWRGKKVSIYFGGVYMDSKVFINDKLLGVHPYGFTSFDYDLTPYLKYNKENIIAVRVDNSQQVNCRWYSGSGIYRHVWLIETNPIHIAHWGVEISTPEVSSEQAIVRIKTCVKNQTSKPQTIILSTHLTNEHNKIVGENHVPVYLQANDEKEISQVITVQKPQLWSPRTPCLYQATFRLNQGDKVIDHLQKTFGIRSITYSADKGLLLNGKPIKLDGGCVHDDNGCLGAAAYDRAEERKIQLLKSAGFNAVRTAHNPPSEAFLNACDKLGLMVVDEAFDCWRVGKNKYDYARFFDQWSQRDLAAMVLRDRNHPSVIMWSIGNEIIERESHEAIKTAKMLVGAIHKMDPTRPVTSAIPTWDNKWSILDSLMATLDICGYNYELFRAPSDHQRVPSRIIVQTESYPKDAFKNWEMVNSYPYIIGDFVWTAMDYLGESGIGRYYYPWEPKGEPWEADLFPWHGSYCGDIDLTGWRKPVSHYRNILWNNDEKLYLAVQEPNPAKGEIKLTSWAVWPTWESWTWPGHEGKTLQVEVYSKYPKVRLYLNNKLIGEKQTTQAQEFKATFPVPYTPGVLKVVGVVKNKEIESKYLRTAGAPAKIKLIPDRKMILANGEDLSFITIEINDKEGVFQPNADNRLQFKITGPGVIAGVANANLKDLDPYVGSTRKVWHGRALVVIKSTRKPGDIILTASSKSLPDVFLVIKTRKRLSYK